MASSTSRLRWSRPDQFLNSWTNADADQPVEFSQDNDNIVHLRGVLSGGTSGTAAFYLPEYMRPRRDTVRLLATSAAHGTTGYVEITTAGAVTLYDPNIVPHNSKPSLVTEYACYYNAVGGNYGLQAGNGVYANLPGGWQTLDTPSITGYTRQYRWTFQYYYNPNAATTASTLSLRLTDAGGSSTVITNNPTPVATTADKEVQGGWATDTFIDGNNGAACYLEAKGDWTTAVGNMWVRHVRIDMRYVTTTTQAFYLDGLNFHPAI